MSAQRAVPFSLANYEPACEYRSDLRDLVAMHTELLLHAYDRFHIQSQNITPLP